MALTKEDLQAIGQLMDVKLEPIYIRLDKMDARMDKMEARMDNMQEQLDAIKEDTAITRTTANALVEWAEHVSVVTAVKFPVMRAE